MRFAPSSIWQSDVAQDSGQALEGSQSFSTYRDVYAMRITGGKHITAELYPQARPERRACAPLAKPSNCATIGMLPEGQGEQQGQLY